MAYGLEFLWYRTGGLGNLNHRGEAEQLYASILSPLPGHAGTAASYQQYLNGADQELGPELDGNVDGATNQQAAAPDIENRIENLAAVSLRDQFPHADAALDQAASKNQDAQHNPPPAARQPNPAPGEPPPDGGNWRDPPNG